MLSEDEGPEKKIGVSLIEEPKQKPRATALVTAAALESVSKAINLEASMYANLKQSSHI